MSSWGEYPEDSGAFPIGVTGAVLSGVATLFGAIAMQSPRPEIREEFGVFLWIGIAGFVMTALSCLFLVWHDRRW